MSSTLVHDSRRWRVTGAVAGLTVGLGFSVAAAVVFGLGGTLIAIPVLVTAVTGGWHSGPAAADACSRAEWSRVVLKLAVWAVVVGALMVGTSFGLSSAAGSGQGLLAYVGIALGVTLASTAIGIIVFGLVVLPFTLIGAVLWAVLMQRARDR